MRDRDHHGMRDDDVASDRWRAVKGKEALAPLWSYVRRLEMVLSPHYDKMYKMEYLFNPTDPRYAQAEDTLAIVNENMVATCAETIVAGFDADNIRVRVLTDGANWEQQRRAKALEIYLAGVDKLLGKVDLGEGIKWGFVKGSSLVYVGHEHRKVVRYRVPINEVLYDPSDMHAGVPGQLHWITLITKERLTALYPKRAEDIESQGEASTTSAMVSIASRASLLHPTAQVAFMRSWALPIGRQGSPGFVPGRYVASIENCILEDREWKDDFYPFAKYDWGQTETDWFGISGAERIAGIQRALNRRNWQIEQGNDRAVMPVTYVQQADSQMTIKRRSSHAAIAVYNGTMPHTVEHRAVNSETYQSRFDLRAAALEEVGVSSMAAHSTKPAGVDSGAGLREYRDQTTQRFSEQEKAAEQHYLEIQLLTLWACKELGEDAPKVPDSRQFRGAARALKFSDVDLEEIKVQLAAASALPKTASGRQQQVLEWAQAGLISRDDAMRLMRHPDLERAVSLYTAALEQVEWCIESIAEGRDVMPEPFMNLSMSVVKGQQQYLIWSTIEGVPERVLEAIRDFTAIAAWMESTAKGGAALPASPAPDGMQMPQPPAQAMTGMMPALPPA